MTNNQRSSFTKLRRSQSPARTVLLVAFVFFVLYLSSLIVIHTNLSRQAEGKHHHHHLVAAGPDQGWNIHNADGGTTFAVRGIKRVNVKL